MVYALVGLLILFLVFIFIETKRKAQRVMQVVTEEKKAIAEDSGMTASIGVFSPDVQTTVIIGASEELGIFYYRMLRQAKVIIRSRINMANLVKIEFLLNGKPYTIPLESGQPTLSMRCTEIADNTLGQFSTDSIRQVQRAAMQVVFYDEAGNEKKLEITTFRQNDDRQKFERVQLLKTTVWWVAFLQLASREARRVRASIEPEKKE